MRLAHSPIMLRKRLIASERRGVTLLELAIVLGVIGALTGALFTAASMANYRANFNQASDELNEIAVNMHNLFAGRVTSYAALNAVHALTSTPDFSYYSPLYIQQSVFPYEMLSPSVAAGVTPPAGTAACNPWNSNCATSYPGTAQVALAASPITGTDPVQFVVRYTNINAEICADLITRNSLPGRDTGLTQINVNTAAVGIANNTSKPLPISSLTATGACSATTNTIDWYFNVGS